MSAFNVLSVVYGLWAMAWRLIALLNVIWGVVFCAYFWFYHAISCVVCILVSINTTNHFTSIQNVICKIFVVRYKYTIHKHTSQTIYSSAFFSHSFMFKQAKHTINSRLIFISCSRRLVVRLYFLFTFAALRLDLVWIDI